MPTPPSSPPTGSEARTSMLFRTLQKGREKKLGRALTEPELLELEAYASKSASRGVHVAKQRSVSEAAMAAVASLPKVLPTALLPNQREKLERHSGGRDLSRSARRRGGRVIEDVGTLLKMALKDGRRGPQLPAYGRKTSALYLQQDDLEAFIPDGWGATFPAEAGALGRAMGLPPRAVPLLCLLEWTSSFRPALSKDKHECGAGFQVSLDWLARKLGCTRVWAQAMLNRLDPYARWRRDCLETKRANRRRAKRHQVLLQAPEKPTGTAYVHRFRRLKRFEDVKAPNDPRRIWVDAEGRPHVYVDVRGVVYLTAAGRGVLGRPRRPLEAALDVGHRGRRSRWLLSARLRRGHNLLYGGHVGEVLENRRELLGATGVPENLSPNHTLQKPSPPS